MRRPTNPLYPTKTAKKPKQPTPYVRDTRLEAVYGPLVRERAVLSFRSKGRIRTVEAHLLGYNTAGHLELSCWQRSGGSAVDWRAFLVREVRELSDIGERFTATRPGFNPRDPQMQLIVAHA